MKCPKCGFENIDKAKFCNECGNKLEIPCLSCSSPNPPGSKFCYECGKPDTKIEKEGNFSYIKCTACGARHAIKSKVRL